MATTLRPVEFSNLETVLLWEAVRKLIHAELRIAPDKRDAVKIQELRVVLRKLGARE